MFRRLNEEGILRDNNGNHTSTPRTHEVSEMSRQRWQKLMVALCEKVYAQQGKHVDGETLRFYRGKGIASIEGKTSYAEAWKSMKPIREMVGM